MHASPLTARAAAPRVVVIGGGFGGATAAKYVRRFDDGIEVAAGSDPNDPQSTPTPPPVPGPGPGAGLWLALALVAWGRRALRRRSRR